MCSYRKGTTMLRLILSLFATAVALAAQVTPKSNATLEGRVISSTTGAPLAKAMVTLDSGTGKQIRAVTAKDGTFQFEDLEPRDHSLSFERAGYLPADGHELSLESGEHMKGVEL